MYISFEKKFSVSDADSFGSLILFFFAFNL